jgi:hypothetical protein
VHNETSYWTDEEIQRTLHDVRLSAVKMWLGGKVPSDFGMRTSSWMKGQTMWVNGTFMDSIVQLCAVGAKSYGNTVAASYDKDTRKTPSFYLMVVPY